MDGGGLGGGGKGGMTERGGRIEDGEQAREFILAGKSRVTIKSLVTGNHFSYRITKNKPRPGVEYREMWFVDLLSGPNNELDWRYMGVVDSQQDYQFRQTMKSAVKEGKGREVWEWVWEKLRQGVLPEGVEVWHEGRCGRCGRLLTTVESISRGLGPECAQK
jgi:hypothetical protein